MKKIITSLCILAIGVSSLVSPASANAESYKETKIVPEGSQNRDLMGLFVNAKGKLRISTQEWEQSVYGISGNKLKKVSDPMVKAAYNAFDFVKDKVLDTEFCSNTINKKGTAGYFTNGQKVFKYNKKGKILKSFDLLKKMNSTSQTRFFRVSTLKWVNKDFVAVNFRAPFGKTPRVCLVNMSKGKIVKKYSTKYTSLCGTDGKNIYVTSGSIEKGTEKIVKLKASSGKKVSSISTKPIRDLAADRTEKDDAGETFYRDKPFSTYYANGKLYLKYLTGIYTWNEKGKSFDTVLDGRDNENYTSWQCGGDFVVIKDKMYVLDIEKSGVYVYTVS